MNSAHLHIALIHFPIVLPIVGLLLLTTGILLRSETLKKVSFIIFIAAAASSAGAILTGEQAGELVEKLPGISESLIEKHEEQAELFAIISYVLGGLSIIALWAIYKRRFIATILSYMLVVISIISLFMAIKTGNTGGEIRHTEIRSGQNIQPAEFNGNSKEPKTKGEDDD